MRDTLAGLRPRLQWYHYLLVVFLALPIGADPSTPAAILGTAVAAFFAIWAATAVYRHGTTIARNALQTQP